MSLLFGKRAVSLTDVGVPSRRGAGGSGTRVSTREAMSVSPVWAALMLRAGLESTLPIDCLIQFPGAAMATPMPTPQVLITPSEWADGQPMSISDWLHQRRLELDRYGNFFAIIRAKDGNGIPRRLDPVSGDDVVVHGKGATITKYTIKHKDYAPDEIWHDRQYVEAGSPLGLSPIAAAARKIRSNLTALQFALDWFDRNASPSVILTNKARELNASQATVIQRRVAASFQTGEPAVVGNDWQVDMQAARAKDVAFLELENASIADIARFFAVTPEMIAAATSGQNVTYANVSEQMLHFLVLHFHPALVRTEHSLNRLVPGQGFVKLNSEALLRMDPQKRRQLLIAEVGAGLKTVNEARALENLGPIGEAP